jgi:hypothetical protein
MIDYTRNKLMSTACLNVTLEFVELFRCAYRLETPISVQYHTSDFIVSCAALAAVARQQFSERKAFWLLLR